MLCRARLQTQHGVPKWIHQNFPDLTWSKMQSWTSGIKRLNEGSSQTSTPGQALRPASRTARVNFPDPKKSSRKALGEEPGPGLGRPFG
eukprot:11964295-Karenia_brevis.AAC.1